MALEEFRAESVGVLLKRRRCIVDVATRETSSCGVSEVEEEEREGSIKIIKTLFRCWQASIADVTPSCHHNDISIVCC